MMGKVLAINHKRGLVVFQDVSGNCGYFEVLGAGDLEKGDIIMGNLRSLGGETITKRDTKESIEVFIEDFDMTHDSACAMII